ncbi:MAG: cation:proton antiporter, partial [Leptospiraceae bacterium]|nr:cation:proton antiporter [Leptospiraceae bacterium]
MWCSGSAGALISRLKYPFFYLLTLAALAALLAFVFLKGERLEIGRHVVAASTDKAIWDQFREAFKASLHHPIAVFLAQIAAIILVARSLGWLCRRIGQPAVIGEIVAGILLGPSLMGWVAPEFSKALFPPQSFTYLQYLSQVGLILFMFVIGSELDLTTL